jgi:hypothetical protein
MCPLRALLLTRRLPRPSLCATIVGLRSRVHSRWEAKLKQTRIAAALVTLTLLVVMPLAPAMAEKKLTPQQQKMKDCGAKWQEHKKTANVKGKVEYQKFLSGCMKSA